MMNICSTCQGAQSECQQRLDADSAYRAHINEALAGQGLDYAKDKDGFNNKNFLWVLVEDYGLDRSRQGDAAALRPAGRPLLRLLRDPPQQPARLRRASRRDLYLEKVIEALGGEVVEYDGARKCCGFPVITMNRDTSLRQAGTHVGDALDAGADCLVTPCPLCHLNLDMQQPEAAKVATGSWAWRSCICPSSSRSPSASPKELGMSKHIASTEWVEERLAAVPA